MSFLAILFACLSYPFAPGLEFELPIRLEFTSKVAFLLLKDLFWAWDFEAYTFAHALLLMERKYQLSDFY